MNYKEEIIRIVSEIQNEKLLRLLYKWAKACLNEDREGN